MRNFIWKLIARRKAIDLTFGIRSDDSGGI